MIAIDTDDKSLAVREAFLSSLRERRRMMMRERPSEWRPTSSSGNAKARLRRFDLSVGATREDWESFSLCGRGGCSPVLSVSMPKDLTGTLPDDPFERVIALCGIAERLSTMEPAAPHDEAEGAALAAAFGLRRIEASVTLSRPSMSMRPTITIASMRGPNGFSILPARKGKDRGAFEPLIDKLALFASAAAPRLAEALSCSWQANDGGGHAFLARPSSVGAIWREREKSPVDALRLCADWADELSQAGLA